MKTCVECKYVTRVGDQKNVPHCGHENAIVSTDMITGQKRIASCEEMRRNPQRCGVEAILHEPNNSSEPTLFIERLKNWFFL